MNFRYRKGYVGRLLEHIPTEHGMVLAQKREPGTGIGTIFGLAFAVVLAAAVFAIWLVPAATFEGAIWPKLFVTVVAGGLAWLIFYAVLRDWISVLELDFTDGLLISYSIDRKGRESKRIAVAFDDIKWARATQQIQEIDEVQDYSADVTVKHGRGRELVVMRANETQARAVAKLLTELDPANFVLPEDGLAGMGRRGIDLRAA